MEEHTAQPDQPAQASVHPLLKLMQAKQPEQAQANQDHKVWHFESSLNSLLRPSLAACDGKGRGNIPAHFEPSLSAEHHTSCDRVADTDGTLDEHELVQDVFQHARR